MFLVKKYAIITCSILLFLKTASLTATITENIANAAIASGLGLASTALALGAHVVTEYPIVYTHEVGHAVAAGISPRQWPAAISIECLLKEHPLAVFFPFRGKGKGGFKYNYHLDEKIVDAAGPLFGIAAAYASVLLAHGVACRALGGSFRQGLTNGYNAPLTVYSKVANGICDVMVKKSAFHLPSPIILTLNAFTLLKSCKILGEILYGLTPFSIQGGDGANIWNAVGLKKDYYTVSPLTGFCMAVTPACAAIGYGLCKGIYSSIKGGRA